MSCVLHELGRRLAKDGRLAFNAEELRLARRAVDAGCVADPWSGPEGYAAFVAAIRAHAAGPSVRSTSTKASPTPAPHPVSAKRLTPAERRAAIEAALRANPAASDRAVGKAAGCDGKTVARIRAALGMRNAHADSAGQDHGMTTG